MAVSLVVGAPRDGCTATFLVARGALLWAVPAVPLVRGEESSLGR